MSDLKKEFEEIKQKLIPIQEITYTNKYLFYHKTKLNKLNDNQAITHSNIGESMLPIMDKIVEYIDDVKKNNYVEVSFVSSNRYSACNTNINYFPKGTKINEKVKASQIYSYMNILEEKLSISSTVIDLDIKLKIDNRDINVEPYILYIDFEHNSVNYIQNKVGFVPTSIFSLIIVGVKIIEDIEKEKAMDIAVSYKIDNYFIDGTSSSEDKVIINDDSLKLDFNIKNKEIPFFNIVNMFGNNTILRDLYNNKFDLTDNNYFTDSSSKIPIKDLFLNYDSKINIVDYGNFIIFNKSGKYTTDLNIEFDLYELEDSLGKIYYPNISPIVYHIKKVIDEL